MVALALPLLGAAAAGGGALAAGATAATALTVASGASSALGGIVGAVGASTAGSEEAQAYEYNAAIARQNAAIATAQARATAAQEVQQTEQNEGQVTAEAGASGVTVNAGSPLEVLQATAATGELNRELALYQGAVSASGYLNQGRLDLLQAQSAYTGGEYMAGATLLTGFGGALRTASPLFNGPVISGAASAPSFPGVPTGAGMNVNNWTF